MDYRLSKNSKNRLAAKKRTPVVQIVGIFESLDFSAACLSEILGLKF